MRRKVTIWWQARSDRERLSLLVWSGGAALVLIWLVVLSPLSRRVAYLEKRVPELETRLGVMRAQPLDKSLAQGENRKSEADLRSALFSLLSERKVSAELRALSSSRVEMRLPGMPMKDALELLMFMRQESGARVLVLNVKTDAASDASAHVVAELERAQ